MAVAVGSVHADPTVERRLISPFNAFTTNFLGTLRWARPKCYEMSQKLNHKGHIAAGGGAGIMEALSCHPLDTIKVRMQLLRNDPRVSTIPFMFCVSFVF